jgi:hypothetical protein
MQITSYNLSLREIDTVQDETEYVPNALEAVLRKGHLDLLREPLLQTILRFKWEAFAKWQVRPLRLGSLCKTAGRAVREKLELLSERA